MKLARKIGSPTSDFRYCTKDGFCSIVMIRNQFFVVTPSLKGKRMSDGAQYRAEWGGKEVVQKIRECRNAIRYHRDQIDDDRCFLDDFIVWSQLPNSREIPTLLLEEGDAMRLCEIFYAHRRADIADPLPRDAITDPLRWDDDLLDAPLVVLLDKLFMLNQAIRVHRDIFNRYRTVDDDRALYAILPEKLPADFRLPSEAEFLGAARAPYAGCFSFWCSHVMCRTSRHDFHGWGPCGPSKKERREVA